MKIREITQSEREQLRELTSCADGAVARRARAVLMASDAVDSHSIAQSLGISERTVRYAVKRFSNGGLEAIMHCVPPGRPRSVSDCNRELLIDIIRRSPTEFGINSEHWNLSDLAVVARSEGVLPDVSHWTVRREVARLINLDPELRNRVNIPDQKQPGAPPANPSPARNSRKRETISTMVATERGMALSAEIPGANGPI